MTECSAVSIMCEIIPEVVVFPFVPVTVIISFLIYCPQLFKKSGLNFKTSFPAKEVPELFEQSFIPVYAALANNSDE